MEKGGCSGFGAATVPAGRHERRTLAALCLAAPGAEQDGQRQRCQSLGSTIPAASRLGRMELRMVAQKPARGGGGGPIYSVVM